MTALPAPAKDQAFWTVSALEAGTITLPERLYITDYDPTVARKCPSLAFLLKHSVSGQTLVFDLGIRKDTDAYPPAVQKWVAECFKLECEQDVAESLLAGGLDPGAVDFVAISHFHFDHVGDPSPFSRATFLAGIGGQALLDDGYPANAASTFEPALLPRDRTQFLDIHSAGAPLGPFERALDYFHDGSCWIVDAPGHIPGHVNLLVRTSPEPEGGWLYLGADTCHDLRLLNGERHICVYEDGGSAHVDHKVAAEHIARVRTLRDTYGVKVILAHEYKWDEEHKDEYFPGTLKV